MSEQDWRTRPEELRRQDRRLTKVLLGAVAVAVLAVALADQWERVGGAAVVVALLVILLHPKGRGDG